MDDGSARAREIEKKKCGVSSASFLKLSSSSKPDPNGTIQICNQTEENRR